MPCTQKTTKLIVGGNNYVITVKGNQPRLFQQLQAPSSRESASQVWCEKTRNRVTCRIINVFMTLVTLTANGRNKSLVQVESIGIRQGNLTNQLLHQFLIYLCYCIRSNYSLSLGDRESLALGERCSVQMLHFWASQCCQQLVVNPQYRHQYCALQWLWFSH